MTRETRQPDLPEIEPELPELPRLRELSQIELPSADVARAVFGRIQTTLSTSVPVARRGLRVPTWALALGMVIVVPSAFAATSVGATLVRQTVDWVNHAFALVDTTTAEREETRDAPSLPANRPTTAGVPALSGAQAVPMHSSAENRSCCTGRYVRRHPNTASASAGAGARRADSNVCPRHGNTERRTPIVGTSTCLPTRWRRRPRVAIYIATRDIVSKSEFSTLSVSRSSIKHVCSKLELNKSQQVNDE